MLLMLWGAGRLLRGWPRLAIYWRELASHGRSVRKYFCGSSHNADAQGMPKEDNGITFEGCDPPMLFREFAAECMELAQTSSEKRALYLKMASVWHQMAQRWEKKG